MRSLQVSKSQVTFLEGGILLTFDALLRTKSKLISFRDFGKLLFSSLQSCRDPHDGTGRLLGLKSFVPSIILSAF